VSQLQSFQVYARDMYGNLMQYGGDVPSMVAVGQDGVSFRGRVTDYMNSTYLIEYEPVEAGNFLVYVTMGCCPPHPNVGISAEVSMMSDLFIMGAPFQLVVVPAVIDVTRSIVTGAGAVGGVVGDMLTFRVSFRDIFNNPTSDTRTHVHKNGSLGIPLSESDFVVLFSKYNSVNITAPSNLVAPSQLTITITEWYASISYVLNHAGFYNMSVSIKGSVVNGYPIDVKSTQLAPTLTSVLGSPLIVTLYPAKADPSKTVCRGLGLRQAHTNKSTSFEISLFDQFKNSIVTGGNKFYMKVVGDAKSPLSRPNTVVSRNSLIKNPSAISDPVTPTCVDNQNGKYFCSYIAAYDGPHELHIYLLNYSTTAPGGLGLTGLYYSGPNSLSSAQNSGTSNDFFVKIDPVISFSWPSGYISALSTSSQALNRRVGEYVRWQGYLLAPRSDIFMFLIDASYFSTTLYIDKVLIYDSSNSISNNVSLTASFSYEIRLEAYVVPSETDNPLSLKLLWSTPDSKWSVIPQFYLYDSAIEIPYSPFPVSVS